MCTFSMVGDYASKRIPEIHPWVEPYVQPGVGGTARTIFITGTVSRDEFDALRKEIVELKELLVAAKKFDTATGQPDCESDEKIALIKRLAEMTGVDLADLFEVSE